jgi:prepilin-type N-terminal cleavage/methylation domain-containing protein
MRKHFKKGFTLIELLVVISIIALLSTLAVVSLNNARAKGRDAKRVSDIKQVQTALELRYADTTTYPTSVAGVDLGSAAAAKCLDTDGWSEADAGTAGDSTTCDPTIYMGQVPEDTGSSTEEYVYTSAAGTTYSIAFSIEGPVGSLTCSSYPCSKTATPSGIQ